MTQNEGKNGRKITVIFLILVALAILVPVVQRVTHRRTAETLPAPVSQLNQAVEQAKSQRRPIFLEFTAVWCGYCRAFEENILTDPEVKNALDDFVYLRADLDQDTELAGKLNVTGVPAFFVLKAQNHTLLVVNQLTGAPTKEQFLQFLAESKAAHEK